MSSSDRLARYGRMLLLVNGVLLALVAAVQAALDLAGAFTGLGPLAAALGGNPDAIGYFEAHGLALIFGILMIAHRNDARWHWIAATIHLLLGGANLLFWPTFTTYGLVPAGIAATSGHVIFATLQLAAAFARSPQLRSGPGTVFRLSALVTLATGMALHTSSLVLGREAFVERLFTPLFDAIFAVPMTIAGVAAILAFRRALFDALWQRIVYIAMAIYFLISIVIHLRTLVTWDTGYVLAFPSWYPIAALALMIALTVFVIRQRFAASAANA